jgi:hypothetical protein
MRRNTDSSFVIVSECSHIGSSNTHTEYTNFDKTGTIIGASETGFEMPDSNNYPALADSGTGNLFVVNTPRNGQQVSHFFN